MARTIAGLPAGTRITDYLSLGVVTKDFPLDVVHRVLAETDRQSQRQRDLPAHVMVYYVIALAFYMQASCREVLRCLLEGLQWLAGPTARLRPAGKSGISQARTRLGAAPLQRLFETVARPLATPATPGAFYRGRWRLMSLDGTTLDVADTPANEAAFGRPSSHWSARSAFPQVSLLALAETGTHAIGRVALGRARANDTTLAHAVVPHLTAGMLCLADRAFVGYDLWRAATQHGADLLWRAKARFPLPCERRLPDGSYLSHLKWNRNCRSAERTPIRVRVIEYTMPAMDAHAQQRDAVRNRRLSPRSQKRSPTPTSAQGELVYRLVTTLLDPAHAPAEELAALYHERWEIEGIFDEFKTHLRGRTIVLRSQTPELVRQEVYGLLLAHFAIRGLMHEAAVRAATLAPTGPADAERPDAERPDAERPRARDPDTLSFVHTVHVIRRTQPHIVAIPPSGPRPAPAARARPGAAGTARRTRQLELHAPQRARGETGVAHPISDSARATPIPTTRRTAVSNKNP